MAGRQWYLHAIKENGFLGLSLNAKPSAGGFEGNNRVEINWFD
jgi:hypothetical protein